MADLTDDAYNFGFAESSTFSKLGINVAAALFNNQIAGLTSTITWNTNATPVNVALLVTVADAGEDR